MRNLLGTLTMLAIIVGAVGYSRDWFKVSRETQGTETQVQVQINRERIRKDTKTAAEVAQEIRENIEKKLAERVNGDQVER